MPNMSYYRRPRRFRQFLARFFLCPLGIHGTVEPIDATHPFFYGPYDWVCGRCGQAEPRIAFAPKTSLQRVAGGDAIRWIDGELSSEEYFRRSRERAEQEAKATVKRRLK